MRAQVHTGVIAFFKHMLLKAILLCACSNMFNAIVQLNFYPTLKDFKRCSLARLQLLPARGSSS
jgi:hypothetical protein